VTITLVLLVVFGVGLPLALWGVNRQLSGLPQRQVEARAITAIAALRAGEQARIRGVVVAREPLLKSAIGGKPCVGYQATIHDAQDPALLVSREGWSSFLVTDETGTVAVEGRLEALLDSDDGGVELPPAAYPLLAEDGVRMRELWGPRQFRFRERLLCVGDRVSVVGRPSAAGDSRGGSRDTSPARQVMRGSAYDPVVVMDDDEEVGKLRAQPPPLVPIQEAPRVGGPSRRAITERQSTAIAALNEGEPAKISGVVSAREPLVISPISGRACVGYRIAIHQRPEAHPEHTGVLVVRREAWPSFLVRDDSGTAVVDGPFSILLDPDDGGWTNLPASVYTLLQEANVPLDKEFAFRETLLAPGDRVAVVGRPSLEIDPAGQGALREAPRLFVLRGSEEEPVAVIDDEPAV
jgi:hypothetical protein